MQLLEPAKVLKGYFGYVQGHCDTLYLLQSFREARVALHEAWSMEMGRAKGPTVAGSSRATKHAQDMAPVRNSCQVSCCASAGGSC